ncbi:MAG TPA: bile acid:sodium symporter [Glaciihabitans sp.]|jgi:ACR3 family arsenite efflux pump ArsB|nr:bile acid:sodium symporter [Glaciihabitans sp.]
MPIVWLERHQVLLYLVSILGGAGIGLVAPAVSPVLESGINPVLGLLLFATFLSVPLVQVGAAFRDIRFLLVVLSVNFLVVPVVVFGLSRFVSGNEALLLGLLLVLLTPCVDYVVVFTGLAGGARDRLLAAAPLLMLLQLVLLPGYLWLFAGAQTTGLIETGPFVEAFVGLILIPLVAAAMVQWWARSARTGRAVRRVESVMATAMVPLMMATLAVVVGSQIAAVGDQFTQLVALIPLYVAFLVIMLGIGITAGRLTRLDVAGTRALVFSVSTRNSLVVLPLALALPATFALTPLAVVTQTLVELVGMVIFVRLVPRLVPPGTVKPRAQP